MERASDNRIPRTMILDVVDTNDLPNGANVCMFSHDGKFVMLGQFLAVRDGPQPRYAVSVVEYNPGLHVLYNVMACPDDWGDVALCGSGYLRLRHGHNGHLMDGEIHVVASINLATGEIVVIPFDETFRLRSHAMRVEWRKGG